MLTLIEILLCLFQLGVFWRAFASEPNTYSLRTLLILTYQHSNDLPQTAYRVVGLLGLSLRSAGCLVGSELLVP